jgi:hypothetical protein
MVRRRGLITIILIAAVVTGFADTGLAQRDGVDPYEPYQSLLNKVLPWPQDVFTIDGVMIVMRFMPSFHPESQIILRFDDKGTATVDYIKLRTGITEFLHAAVNPGRDDPDNLNRAALEKALGLQRTIRRMEGRVAGSWLDEFWKSLARSPEQTKNEIGQIQLDGTMYELRVITQMASWQLRVADDEVANKTNGRVPIVQWMNSVRVELDASR